MKIFILSCFIALTTTNLFSQDKKDLTISLGTGIYNSPYYTNAKSRPFYNFDFSYNISKRHIIATTFLAGKHFYYDNIRSNNAVPLTTPGYEKNTNATAEYLTFSILYKYNLYNNNKLSITAGTGAGIMSQTMIYPYTEGTSVHFRQSNWDDLVFPVRLEFDHRLSGHFKIGLIGGLFIHPDYPVLGYHAGLSVSYVIK